MLILLSLLLYFAIKKQNTPSPHPPKKKIRRKTKILRNKRKPNKQTNKQTKKKKKTNKKTNKQGFIDHVLKIIWKYIGIMYICIFNTSVLLSC